MHMTTFIAQMQLTLNADVEIVGLKSYAITRTPIYKSSMFITTRIFKMFFFSSFSLRKYVLVVSLMIHEKKFGLKPASHL